MASRDEDPNPRENLLKSGANSPMQFMKEYLIHDSELSSLVRFRGPFIMPDWSGVEENESDYVVQESWEKIQYIANDVYGDVMLMWVIAARNDLDLPDVQLHRGMKLKIPNKDWVEDNLLTQSQFIKGSG